MEPFLLLLLVIAIVVSIVIFGPKKRSSSFQIPLKMAALSPKNRQEHLPCQLVEKTTISHDTYRFKFALPQKDKFLGILVGQHLIVHEQIKTLEQPEGELVERKYTPVSLIGQRGSFELLIKIYRPDENQRFPNGGKLTSWLDHLQIDRPIHISGPYGGLQYQGNGIVQIKKGDDNIRRYFKKIVMIAGGSGITPMYQIIHSIINDGGDRTQLSLLFANKSESDILLYEELKTFAKINRIKLFLTLDNPPEDWAYFKGFVSADMVRDAFGQIEPATLCLTCGPGPMNSLAAQHYRALGAPEAHIHVF